MGIAKEITKRIPYKEGLKLAKDLFKKFKNATPAQQKIIKQEVKAKGLTDKFNYIKLKTNPTQPLKQIKEYGHTPAGKKPSLDIYEDTAAGTGRKKGGKIKYKARGGEAGKGIKFKSSKPLPPMHRGTGPKVSRKDTTKPTKSIKKTNTDKNKKLLDALAAVNKKIRGRTNKQIENLIKKQKADKTLVDDRFKHHVATRPSRVEDTRFVGRSDKVSPKKDVASTHRKISTSRFKKGGTITKRKKGGKVGSGSAFVASLYK